jgi:hypothetical protein
MTWRIKLFYKEWSDLIRAHMIESYGSWMIKYQTFEMMEEERGRFDNLK